MRLIRRIIIHHSATDHGDVETFRRHHMTVNGWSDVGYHYVIDNEPDGEVQPGRPLAQAGAHARGANADSIGICLVGDGTPPPTPRQVAALVRLCVYLCDLYGVDPAQIIGHRDVCATDCPGAYLYGLLPLIRLLVQTWPRTEGGGA